MSASKENSSPEVSSRRGALRKLWILLGGVIGLEAVWVLFDFFRPRERANPTDKQHTVVTAGPISQFERSTVTAFPSGKFYLARLEDGGFLALSRTCTHLGCTVPWDKRAERFVCPCHNSSFNIRGEVLGAPAPRPLDFFPVRIENKIVKVDIGAPRRRVAFDADQVTNP